MPEGLGQARDAHKSVLSASEGQSGDFVVKVSGTIIIDFVSVSKENRAHQNLALDLIVRSGVLLSHHTAKRVACDQNLVTSEACLLYLFYGIVHVMVNKDRLGGVKYELWKSNPDFLVLCYALGLDFRCKSGVG